MMEDSRINGTGIVEENYLEEFMNFIHEIKKGRESIDFSVDTSLSKLDIAERKREYDRANIQRIQLRRENLSRNKARNESKLEAARKKYESIKIDSTVEKKEPKLQLAMNNIVRIENSIKSIENQLEFLREENEADIAYRMRQYDTFSKKVKELVPEDLPLRFHGCPIYTARDIIKSGEISSSVDRLGFETSYDAEGQISVTTRDTIDTTVRGYAGLTGDYDLPAGCIFVMLPKDKQDADKGDALLMDNIDLERESERFISVITTRENLESVKKWMLEKGFDTSKVHDYDGFIQYLSKNLLKENRKSGISMSDLLRKALEVGITDNEVVAITKAELKSTKEKKQEGVSLDE